MRVSSKGFYAYSKVLSTKEMDNLIDIVTKNIDLGIDLINEAKFDINPKRIDNDLLGCKYCEFRDICFRKEEDIVDLEKQDYKEFLGGGENA
jgi:ATP-dependent helicase/DNAse subunit B